MKMTRDEIEREMVGWIEPLPELPVDYLGQPYHGGLSKGRVWVHRLRFDGTVIVGSEWLVSQLSPLASLDDCLRCVEAKFGPGCWIKQTVAFPAEPGYYHQMRVSSWEPYEYFDNDHAFALALAAMSAHKGQRVEVAG